MTRPPLEVSAAPLEYDYERKLLRPILYARLIFGYYSELGFSRRVQRIMKFYCTLVPLVWITLRYFICINYKICRVYYLFITEIIEFSVFYITSVYSDNNYLKEHYSFIPNVDGDIAAKGIHSKLKRIMLYIILHIALEILEMTYNILHMNTNDVIGRFAMLLLMKPFKIYRILGRLSVIMILTLTYCRVLIFNAMLPYIGSKSSRQNISKKCLKSYIAICNNLENTSSIPKILIGLQLSFGIIDLISVFYMSSTTFSSQISEVNITWWCFYMLIAFQIMFFCFPCVIMEFVLKEIEQAQSYIADQLITSIDEFKRSELQELLEYMTMQPLTYSLWGVITINARLPLAIIAVAVDYVICILQFSYKPDKINTSLKLNGSL